MNNQELQKLLLEFLSNYLAVEEVTKLLSNRIKAKAWFRVFQGYSEKEIEEIMIAIYSHFPTYLPSIKEIEDKCVTPIDLTKFQQEWGLILDTINKSVSHDQMHNLIYSNLSDEAKLALKDLGGITGVKNNIDPKYLNLKRRGFIEDCQRYKGQLRSGLIQPLKVELRETEREDPVFLSKEETAKQWKEVKKSLEMQGLKLSF